MKKKTLKQEVYLAAILASIPVSLYGPRILAQVNSDAITETDIQVISEISEIAEVRENTSENTTSLNENSTPVTEDSIERTVESTSEQSSQTISVDVSEVGEAGQPFKMHYTGEWWDYEGYRISAENAAVSMDFIGHKARVYVFPDSYSGSVDVYIDDKKVSTFSANGDVPDEVARFTSDILEEGRHQIRLLPHNESYLYLSRIEVDHAGIPAESIQSSVESIELDTADSFSLSVMTLPEYSTEDVTFSIQDPTIIKLTENGEVLPLKAGKTNIIAETAHLKKEIPVHVTEATNTMIAHVVTTAQHHPTSQYEELKHHSIDEVQLPVVFQNDEVNGKILLATKREPVQKLTTKVSDFVTENGMISKEAVTVSFLRETSAHIGRGGKWGVIPTDFPVVKVPDIIDKAVDSVDIPAKSILSAWVKIAVPRDAKEGVYKGTLTFESPDLLEPLQIPYSFEVLPILQPEETHFSVELWQYPYTVARYYGLSEDEWFGEKHLSLLRQQLSEYRNAGGRSITTTISENPWNSQTYDKYPSMVKWIKQADGTFTFDFTHYDRYVQLAMEEGIDQQIKSFSITPWDDKVFYLDQDSQSIVQVKLRPGSQEWKDVWGQVLQAYINHLDEKGWFEKAYLALDERPIPVIQEVLSLVQTYKNKDGKSLKVSAAIDYAAENKAILNKIDDISVSMGHITDPEDLRNYAQQRRESGKTTTMYSMVGQYPNSFTRSAPVEAAWVLLYAHSLGLDGYLRWAYDAWVKDPLVSVDHWYWEGGDPFFVYPADKESEDKTPRTSPRFEYLKFAKRLIEKMKFLSEKVPESRDELATILSHMVRPNGKRNSYGAMESTGREQELSIETEVRNIENQVIALSRKYADRLAESVDVPTTILTAQNGVEVDKLGYMADKLALEVEEVPFVVSERDTLTYRLSVVNANSGEMVAIGGQALISIPITREVEKVYRLLENGQVEDLVFIDKGNRVYFEGSDQGTYILYYVMTAKGPGTYVAPSPVGELPPIVTAKGESVKAPVLPEGSLNSPSSNEIVTASISNSKVENRIANKENVASVLPKTSDGFSPLSMLGLTFLGFAGAGAMIRKKDAKNE